jgi:hypothetical protein
LPENAFARVSGEVAFEYDDYKSKTDQLDSSKSLLYQKYSLLYDKRGRLGKYGGYGFALGYEWAALDLAQTDNGVESKSAVNNGHLLYSVDYSYNSKIVPLNIYFFSRDMNRIQSYNNPEALSSINGDTLVPTLNIPNVQAGGTKISTGARLVFGEQKSDSLTSKFPRLVELPRVFIDYSEAYVSNLNSAAPEHSRTRLLNASIAKDSLWFTYKMLDSKDYLTKSDTLGLFYSFGTNAQEQSFHLGTVDNYGQRIWVDLTNWIQISADGVMTKKSDPSSPTTSGTEYNLNLFAIAKRERWDARSFSTFSRQIDANLQLDEDLKIPIYVSGLWSNDTNWQARFEQKDHRVSNNGYALKEQTSFASLRVETFKRSLFTLTPYVAVEILNSDTTKKLSVQGRIETSSTRRFSDKATLNASYEIKRFSEETAASRTDQLTQSLSGKAQYRISNNLIMNADQLLTVNIGAVNASQGTVSSSEKFTDSGSRLTGRVEDISDNYVRSVTNAKIAWSPVPRLRTDIQASLDIYGVKGNELDTIMSFNGSIDYSLPKYAVNASSRYSRRTTGGVSGDEMSFTGYAQVAPAPNTLSSVRATYTRINEFGTVKNTTDVSQRLEYKIPSRKFIGNLIEVSQQSVFLKSSESPIYGNFYTTARQFTLQGKYFVNSNLYASALSRYSLLSPGNVSEWMGGASLGVQYKLLQGSVEYYQGKRTGGNDNRMERRFSANLKKQF